MNPVKLHIIAFCCLPPGAEGQSSGYAAWTGRTTITVPAPGLTRLDLPPGVLNASASPEATPLADLRLVSPSGVETPYDIAWPRIIKAARLPVEAFKATLAGESTVIEMSPPAGGTIDEMALLTNADNFIKAATLEGSNDGTQWQAIAEGEILCRQQGTAKLQIGFPPAVWKRLRVTVDDRRSQPVVFTGASVRLQDIAPRTVPHPVSIRERREEKGEAVLILDLGGTNLFPGVLRVQSPEPVFQRGVNVREATPQGDGTVFTSGSIFRVTHNDRNAAELEIPVHRRIAARELELHIRNGDSPPLRIDAIEATRHPVPMVFNADAAGAWQLFTGNAQAPSPRYDIAALSEQLRDAAATTATAGPPGPNPAFLTEATVPDVGDAGAPLDVSAWAWEKPLESSGTGVFQVELDPGLLANAASDLRDLRVVQNDRQIPYLIQHTAEWRESGVSFSAEPDPKRPGLSRWRITLPAAGFPAAAILANSPTTLFERSVTAWEESRDDFGTRTRRILGSATWRQTPAQGSPVLSLLLSSRPVSDTVFIETENGDNALLQLSSLRLTWPVVLLVFKIADTGPVSICYGNPRASSPRYDLRLVENELAAAPKTNAAFGPAERLRPEKHPRTASSGTGTGSVWLWAALVLVVGCLLWIVAKMLPKDSPADK